MELCSDTLETFDFYISIGRVLRLGRNSYRSSTSPVLAYYERDHGKGWIVLIYNLSVADCQALTWLLYDYYLLGASAWPHWESNQVNGCEVAEQNPDRFAYFRVGSGISVCAEFLPQNENGKAKPSAKLGQERDGGDEKPENSSYRSHGRSGVNINNSERTGVLMLLKSEVSASKVTCTTHLACEACPRLSQFPKIWVKSPGGMRLKQLPQVRPRQPRWGWPRDLRHQWWSFLP